MQALLNRGELFAVELQEQRTLALELCIWIVLAGVLGLMFLCAATALVVFLFTGPARVVALVVLSVIYLVGAVLAAVNARALWKSAPKAFADTIAEGKRDAEWLESFK